MKKKHPRERKESLHRRGYKVEALPPRAQEMVFNGYKTGLAYRKIRAAVQAVGSDITTHALCRYWRKVWRKQRDRLRDARVMMDELKQALQLAPESPSGRVAQEMLYTKVFERLDELSEADVWKLLREAREQAKVHARGATPPVKREEKHPRQAAREVRRRWRQLYGLEEADDDSKEKDSEDERD